MSSRPFCHTVPGTLPKRGGSGRLKSRAANAGSEQQAAGRDVGLAGGLPDEAVPLPHALEDYLRVASPPAADPGSLLGPGRRRRRPAKKDLVSQWRRVL